MENVMVPREPTEEMLRAGVNAFQHAYSSADVLQDWRACYKAMLAAATAVEQEPVNDAYYLQDTRSMVGNDVLFWAKGGLGYTTDLREAQVFTKAQVDAHHKSRSTDVPWPKSYIDSKTRPAVDFQYIDQAEAAHPSPPADKQAAQAGEKSEGLYRKYYVRRLHDPAGKHKDCEYYVLDSMHDKYSADALEAYARCCLKEFPRLANYLFNMAGKVRTRFNYWMPNNEAELNQLRNRNALLEREFSATPLDIFEKCAVIGEDAMCACCWSDEANEAVNHVVGLIRAEALKVGAGGR